jgi:hypothetical protein
LLPIGVGRIVCTATETVRVGETRIADRLCWLFQRLAAWCL